MAKIEQINYAIKGKKVLFRNLETKDAENVIHLLKKINTETPFLLREPDEFTWTLEQEVKFIQNIMDSEVNLLVAAEVDSKIVGTCGINGNSKKRLRHSANLGIAIEKEYWGMGIGKKLIEAGIKWAKEIDISRITLQVDTNNIRALNLYLRCGFEVEGTLINDKKLADGTFVNSYTMALLLKQ